MTDIVITYVTAEDPIWLKDYKSAVGHIVSNDRFFDWGFLRYILRGIETNMPWINKVHLVVAKQSQVPSWIDVNKIHVVTHDEIIPSGLLPTFNSCTIELFLHKIPGLAEQYIYLNDDTIPINPSKETDYFENGVAKTNLEKYILRSTIIPGIYLNQCFNSTKVALRAMGATPERYYFRPDHSCTTFLKSVCEEMYEKVERDLLNSTSKIRTKSNINQYSFLAYMKLNDKLQSSLVSHKYISFETDIYNMVEQICGNSQWICINDNKCDDRDRTRYRGVLGKTLSEKFPNKSSFESEGIKQTTISRPSRISMTSSNSNSRNNVVKTDIDFIFPYVTMDDPEWQNQYKKYHPNQKEDWDSWAAGIERFRDVGLLKYMFRSVAINMPWINKMHMIVSSESQVPNWINRDEVNIVIHKDFIPEQHLPTFNSTTIEMFIPFIEGLSNRFIYSNDDIYITRNLAPGNFFDKNTPIFKLIKRKYQPGAPNDPIRKSSIELVCKTNCDFVYDTQHICMPYIKDNMIKFYGQNIDRINKSCSKFREPYNLNQYIYAYNQALHIKYIDKPIKVLSTCIDSKHSVKYKQNYSLFSVCCLNDSNNSTNQDISFVINKLSKMFPKKCKYEI